MSMERFENVRTIERHHGDSAKIRGKKSQRDAQSERRKQILAYTEKKSNREKYDNGNQHDGQNCKSHFVGAVNGGDLRFLTELDMPVDIFKDDYGIVDQAREREGQAAQHHTVDRAARHMKDEEGNHHRKRD